jgi:hypothetical protein
MNWNLFILFLVILGVIFVYSNNFNRIELGGIVYYIHPSSDYEKAVDELARYVPVCEGYIPQDERFTIHADTVYWWGLIPFRVDIMDKEPCYVYHEMNHVLHPKESEREADLFAASKGYPVNGSVY